MYAVPEHDFQDLQGSVQGFGKLHVEGVEFEGPRPVPFRPFNIAGETLERQGCFEVVDHQDNPLAFRWGRAYIWLRKPRYRLCPRHAAGVFFLGVRPCRGRRVLFLRFRKVRFELLDAFRQPIKTVGVAVPVSGRGLRRSRRTKPAFSSFLMLFWIGLLPALILLANSLLRGERPTFRIAPVVHVPDDDDVHLQRAAVGTALRLDHEG